MWLRSESNHPVPVLTMLDEATKYSLAAPLRGEAGQQVIKDDIREERFVSHTLQLAIQASLDAASHIVSDERLGEPRTNRELFEQWEQAREGISRYFSVAFAPEARVVDIGAGSGRDLAGLVAEGFEAYGIEPVKELRDLALEKRPDLADRLMYGVLPDELPDEEYPLLLTTGRVLYHWHGGELTRRASGLAQICPEATIDQGPQHPRLDR